jgi:hypothetical protein
MRRLRGGFEGQLKRALNGRQRMERDDVLPAQASARHRHRQVHVPYRRDAPLLRIWGADRRMFLAGLRLASIRRSQTRGCRSTATSQVVGERRSSPIALINQSRLRLIRFVSAWRGLQTCKRVLAQGLFIQEQRNFLHCHELAKILFDPDLVQAVEVVRQFQHGSTAMLDFQQHSLHVRIPAILFPEHASFVDTDGLKAWKSADHMCSGRRNSEKQIEDAQTPSMSTTLPLAGS